MFCCVQPRLVAVVVIGCLAFGCGSADPVDEGFRSLVESPSLCRDCIRLESVAILGDTAGPGYVVATQYMVRDGQGRYWAGQYSDMIKVFDADGTFLRRVGRAGAGPMEFGNPKPLFTDGAGRVHVFDSGNVRETVMARDFELHAENRLPGLVRSAAPLPDGRRIIINSALPSGDGTRLPLHIWDGSEVIQSFGGFTQARGPTSLRLRRLISTDRMGRIYSARIHDYRVGIWNGEGQRIGGFVGPLLNETDPLAGPSYWTWEHPPPNSIEAIRMDDAQRLWILRLVRRADWRDHMQEQTAPDGGVRIIPADRYTSIWRTRIDVVDPESGSLIASTDRDELLAGFVGDGLVFENRWTESGHPRLAVWSIGLDTATQH